MNRDAKRINPSLRGRIDIVKGYIRNSNGKTFDGDGYIFKQAVRELRKDGMNIVYHRNIWSYQALL